MQIADPNSLLWLIAVVPVVVALAWTLVDRPRLKRYASAAFRVLAVVFLVLALCQPSWSSRSSRVHATFLVDVSSSVDLESAQAALDSIETAIGRLDPGDTWSLGIFAGELRPVASVAEGHELISTWQTTGGDERFRASTDLLGALEAVRLSLPADRANRVVLFSDAKPTGDIDPGPAIDRLQREGVDLRLARTAGLNQPEAAVVSLAATPAYAYEGELVRLRARVIANHEGRAELRVVHRGVIVARRGIEMAADELLDVEFTVPMVTPGRSLWTVEIAPEQDYFTVNNTAACTVEVSGRPRILVIHTDPGAMRPFERAMERQDLLVDVRPPRGLPQRLDELLAFDAVLLADAPATEFDYDQLEMLRVFVSEFAGGLAMLGSDNSFGLGGYYATPVEDALPLVSRFEKEKEQPSLAMVIVIDKSGSMEGLPIQLARQAARAAVDLIGPRDQIGVVGFDSQAFVASRLAMGSESEVVKAAIDRIGAGGGTFMYAGMDAARTLLEDAPAQIKHMIVLGDGMTQPADHEGLVRALVDRGVTVSMVALGNGADQALMSRLAELGRGRYYQTLDPTNVPQIFTRETVQASRSAIKEDLFASVMVANDPILDGVAEGSLPFTLGFVMTRAKPTARVLLVTETGEPLLAVNNYGLGSTLAYTSDLTPRWGAEWLSWSGFGKFWAQAIRSIIRRPDAGDVMVESAIRGRRFELELTDTGSAIAPAVPGQWEARVISAGGAGEPIEVRQIGIGRWAASVPITNRDPLSVRLYNAQTGAVRVVHHVPTYPAEYNLAASIDPSLDRLSSFDPELIRQGLSMPSTQVAMSPWLLLAACVSFICGVLLRRI